MIEAGRSEGYQPHAGLREHIEDARIDPVAHEGAYRPGPRSQLSGLISKVGVEIDDLMPEPPVRCLKGCPIVGLRAEQCDSHAVSIVQKREP